MTGQRFRHVLFAIACAACTCASFSQAALRGFALKTDGTLIEFDATAPGTTIRTVTITGLAPAETLLGIDFRPATGQLYGLGSGSRIYSIDTTTGAVTQVGSNGAFTLNGTSFGFDFNPVVDRIRIVSNLDQDIRVNPTNGALAATDIALTYAVGDPAFGLNPNVAGSAYSSNFAGALTTVLYGIDADLNILVTQIPPNSGTLNTVGSLGVNIGFPLGFDIVTSEGVDRGYAAASAATSNLYRIDLGTGAATLVGAFAAGTNVTGLAFVPGVTGTLTTRYRLYSPVTLEHLYTGQYEYQYLSNQIDPGCCGWSPEGAIYKVWTGAGSYGGKAAVPNYRLYSAASAQHHWTTDLNEYNALPAYGWTQEGIDSYVLTTAVPGAIPVYRLFLPGVGVHLWTTDVNEHSYLSTHGWASEGVACYVMPL